MIEKENIVHFGYTKLTVFFLFLASCAFVFGAIWIWTYEPEKQLIGGLCILLFGHLTLLYAVSLLDHEAPLLIGPNGLRWRLHSEKEIRWEGIETVEIRRFRYNRFLVLKLRNSAIYPLGEGMHVLRAVIIRTGLIYSWLNRVLGLGDIFITSHVIDAPLEAILKLIDEHRHKTDAA